jgi:protein phosphatase
VLCTDGVWGSVEDEEIRATVVASSDCPSVARILVERALEAGAPDNAAAVVARCVRMPAA